MTTAADIINRAYLKIGVSSEDEALTAGQAAQGLDALNMMMSAWLLAGVDVEHQDLALTDPFPLLPQFHEGTVFLLASRISPDFSVPAAFDADDFFRRIQAAYLQIEPSAMPLAMRRTSSQRRVLR